MQLSVCYTHLTYTSNTYIYTLHTTNYVHTAGSHTHIYVSTTNWHPSHIPIQLHFLHIHMYTHPRTWIVPSRPVFISDLQCNKIWDPTELKFSFNFTWSLPFYIAFENPIAHYIYSLQVYRPTETPSESFCSNLTYVPEVGFILYI